MERQGNLIIMIIILLVTQEVNGSYRSDIYYAYVHNDMHRWKTVIDAMENTGRRSDDFLLELVNYQYGYIAWCIGTGRNSEAKEYLEKGEKNLDILSSSDKNMSKVNSYRSAFYGYRIGLNKLLAPFLGLNSINCAKEAMHLDAQDPFGYIQYGNIQFYMPSVFGGSKKEALEYYLKAKALMNKGSDGISGDWNYLSLLVTIAQSYLYLDDPESSRSCLEELLKLEPGFGWARDELYPKVLEKLKEK